MFDNFSMIEDNEKSNVFFHFLNTCEGKAFTNKIVLGCMAAAKFPVL
jgi:hypothetical protein